MCYLISTSLYYAFLHPYNVFIESDWKKALPKTEGNKSNFEIIISEEEGNNEITNKRATLMDDDTCLQKNRHELPQDDDETHHQPSMHKSRSEADVTKHDFRLNVPEDKKSRIRSSIDILEQFELEMFADF